MPYHALNDPKRLHSLLDAVLLVESNLSLPVVLRQIVESAVTLVDARYGALGVLDESGTVLSEFHTVGINDETRAKIGALPEGRGILGLLIVKPEPLRLADLHAHPDSFGFPPEHPPMHSFLGVPIRVGGNVYGNLYLTEKIGAREFSEADEEAARGLAVAAGISIHNARLHARVAEMGMLADRERIARDLHDTVIQRLFATGLTLQAAAGQIHATEAAERIEGAIDDLDDTIRQIRTTVFALEAQGGGLREELLRIRSESASALGFLPEVVFEGPVDAGIPEPVAHQIVATTREALSNVARHAHATTSLVRLRVGPTAISLEVEDDGEGMPGSATHPGHGHGLANMRSRAEALGGSFSVEARSPRGTRLSWSVPVLV